MRRRRIFILYLLGIACLIMSMSGKQPLISTEGSDGLVTISRISEAQDERDAALILIRQTQIGNPVEGVHIARHHDIGSNHIGARHQIRRQHRLGNQFIALQLDKQHRQARINFLVHLTLQFADGHYLYARCQMRC